MRPRFLLRWSARDLRRRWVQVAVIALILGIGTGTQAGLGSTATWRRSSNDDSFEALHMYDLRVRAAEGTDAPAGAMLEVLGTLPDPAVVATAEERLVLPTQVDASSAGETILVPGRLVGMDVTDGGPHVNGVHVDGDVGRNLSPDDAGQPIAVLERNFAAFHDLPEAGELRVAGGRTVRYVGLGLAPEYFLIITEEGGFFAQANFAALFVPLETAQELTGRPGRVNDLVLRLEPGADVDAVARDLERSFARSTIALGATVLQTEDEAAYRLLYDDIEGDQRFWNVFAALILAGAAFGAFNLANRMVEAQRREIGIGMALGATPRWLAVRPLLVGAQIAALGAVLGVVMGLVVIAAIRPVFTSMLPLPVWNTDFQLGMFVRGAVLALVIPLVATAWPVWRAVRVMPVDAISTTHRTARGGLARVLRRSPVPVSAFRRMPIGNVLRAPRRALLTALGIGAAIATLVAILGMLDSFFDTMDRNDRELLQDHPDRVVVALDRFVPDDGAEVRRIAAASSVGDVEPVLRVSGTIAAPGTQGFEVFIEALDMTSPVWTPTPVRGTREGRGPSVVISEQAADDLGVDLGETVTLEHPALRAGKVVVEESALTVVGIHPSPFRFNVYLDRSQLVLFGAAGLANELFVLPAPAHSTDDVERELFELPGVASVQPVATSTQLLTDSLDEFMGIFRVLELFILLLALLIAYNATSINADERARERATLFAFGVPARRVLALETAEGLLIGLVGTGFGVGAGLLVVRWVTTSVISSTMPELGVDVALSGGTLLTAVALGVIAVALAPLLTVRRLRRMDIPGTLRVVE